MNDGDHRNGIKDMQPDRIIYLFDPLCGWCYGASPMLTRLMAEGTSIEAIPTGLFSGSGARPLDEAFSAYAWANDQRIQRLTGQEFSRDYLEKVVRKQGSMFDSTATTRGIVAAGLHTPQTRFSALQTLQHGRYVRGLDTSDQTVVANLLEEVGLSEAAARVRQPDDGLRLAVADLVKIGKRLLHQFNANGVPALIIEKGESRRLVDSSALFSNFHNLKAHVEAA
jgi:putative protein-disulfide isomerase